MRKWIPTLVMIALMAHGESSKDAPRFSAEDIDGKMVVVDSLLTEGPVYISFWALWCKSCIRELDELGPIYEKYHEKGFELIAISEDGPRSIHRVKPMVRGKDWKFRVVLDPKKELARTFQVISLPTSFLIDTGGKIVRAQQGFKPGMEKLIEEELKQLFIEEEDKEEEVENEEKECSESEEKGEDR